MEDRWGRLASLTGVVFAAFVIVGVVTGGESPNSKSSPAKVIDYYARHRSGIETSAIAFAFAFLAVVLFAGALRSYLRRTQAADGLAALVLAGGVLMATGALTATGVEYGLAHNLDHFSPQTAQTLNFLSQELFLPVLAGAFVFAIASGLAILRGAALPRWLGWVALVDGVAVIVPPASFPALLVFLVWSIVVSVLMYRRSGTGGAQRVAPERGVAIGVEATTP
jgi:hypothetical protein